jgi:putative DNA primase/helicase
MKEQETSLTDPAAIKSQVQAAVAKEVARRPVDSEPSDQIPDLTEIAPGITAKDVDDCFGWNNVGDAILAIKLMQGKFCYDNVLEKPFRFNCTHWLRDKNHAWRKALFEVADIYAARAAHYLQTARELEGSADGKAASKRAEAWMKRVNSCRDVSRVRKIWEAATCGDNSLGISGDEWNQHPTLLPCKNTVIDLETGKTLAPSPSQYFNKAATAPFLGLHEEAPFWMETLHKALRYQDDLIDYFEHMVGFAATGIQTKDFFCAFGPKGSNAKSVIFEWLLKVLGDFAGTLKVEMLLEEKFMRSADGPSPAMLKLRGLRLASTSEASDKHKFAMAKIKSICAGGDRMEARGINAVDIVEFIPEVTLVLHSNFLPKASGSDEAFYNRIKVLCFRANFIKPEEGPEDTSNHIYHALPRQQVDKILTAEMPGIMAWITRCAMKAIRHGDMPKPPNCVLEETNQYRNDQDLVGQFIRECTDRDPNNKEQMKDIYKAFRQWCMEEQRITEKYVMSMNMLGADLKGRADMERIESNKTYYKGIRIKDNCRVGDGDEAKDKGQSGFF